MKHVDYIAGSIDPEFGVNFDIGPNPHLLFAQSRLFFSVINRHVEWRNNFHLQNEFVKSLLYGAHGASE